MRESLILTVMLSVCLASSGLAAGYDASNFSAAGRKLQPAPTGHVPGKDDGPGKGMHNAGEDCGICHRPGGKAPVVFTASGTLYEDRAGRRPLAGGEVILEDIAGNVISMTSNEAGNFWTYAPIASNPYAVASHGGMTEILYSHDEAGRFVAADPADSRSWQYKAWVRHGDHVRTMVTIAPIGGATDPSSRMSCSMHHAPMGNRGALWGTGRSTLSSYPPSRLSFARHVLPILRSKCVPCHIPGDTTTRMATRSDIGSPSTMLDHSGSLDLTSYRGSTVLVDGRVLAKRGIVDVSAAYRRDPDDSPLLSMTRPQPGGAVIHPGGVFWTPADGDYKALRRWIGEGALEN